MHLPVRVLLLLSMSVSAAVRAEDWPHWRGPGRNGVIAASSGFSESGWLEPEPQWKTGVGEGSTSPLVVSGRVYVMGHRSEREHVFCLDAADGSELWKHPYRAPRYGRHAEGDQRLYGGPSSTPEYDPSTGLLYTLGIDGDLHCLDLETGQLRWKLPGLGDPGSCIVTGDDRLITWAGNGRLLLTETARRSPDQVKVLFDKDRLYRTDAWPHAAFADGQLLLKDRAGNLQAWGVRGGEAQ